MADRQDHLQCLRIMRLRGYAGVKQCIESATKDDPPPESVIKSPSATVWEQVMRVKKGG